MNQPASPIPSELLSLKSLKTLSGASVTVWIVCLVLSSLLPEDALKYWHFRIIAFALSILITITIIHYKKGLTKLAYGLLILGNTCYIFINASGINSISKNQLFSKSADSATDSTKKADGFYKAKKSTPMMAGLFPFLKETDWWPDKEIIRENALLKEELTSLKSNNTGVSPEKDSLLKKIIILEEQIDRLADGKSVNEKSLIDENIDLAVRVKTLTTTLEQEKTKNAGLSQSLAATNQSYQDCLNKYDQLVKDSKKPDNTNLVKQLNDLKAEVASLTNSLNACNQKYKDCLNKNDQLIKDGGNKPDYTSLTNQISSLKAEVARLTNSLNDCNQRYKDCLNKYDQLIKDCDNKSDNTALTNQINSLKAEIARLATSLNNEKSTTDRLTKSLTDCERRYKDCLSSKDDKDIASNYKTCQTNYQITERALKLARDSVNRCCLQGLKPQVKKPN